MSASLLFEGVIMGGHDEGLKEFVEKNEQEKHGEVSDGGYNMRFVVPRNVCLQGVGVDGIEMAR